VLLQQHHWGASTQQKIPDMAAWSLLCVIETQIHMSDIAVLQALTPAWTGALRAR
jgi:hypothetical protein